MIVSDINGWHGTLHELWHLDRLEEGDRKYRGLVIPIVHELAPVGHFNIFLRDDLTNWRAEIHIDQSDPLGPFEVEVRHIDSPTKRKFTIDHGVIIR